MFDVAVVGYGPVGAVAAGLLAQAGLSVCVCDRLQGVYEIPRAVALDHEILRVFQQLGVVDQVLRHCEPFTDSEWLGAGGQLIRRMTMLSPPHPQGYVPSMVFTQPPVERALRARVQALRGVTVEEGAECTAIAQDADGVTPAAPCAPAGPWPPTVAAARCAACWASAWTTWTSTRPGWWSTCGSTRVDWPGCPGPACSSASRSGRARW